MKSAVKWLAAVIGFFAIIVLIAVAYLAVPLAPPRPAVSTLDVLAEPAVVSGCDAPGSLLMTIEGESMRTTLEPGEVVALTDYATAGGDIVRGDIVVFVRGDPLTTPPSAKRVIGEPGDTVQLRDGDVYINGAVLQEPYVGGMATLPLSDDDIWAVPLLQLFVMGDNRDNSSDSRSEEIGLVPLEQLVGRVTHICSPANVAGPIERPTYPNVR